MNIYLSKEEIDDLVIEACKKTTAPGSAWRHLAKAAADNAVREVVKWGNEPCPHSFKYPGRKHNCFKCWQELKALVTEKGEG